jgi:FKBP-type peptidyl-prolyl cis-trans isomerase FkpA
MKQLLYVFLILTGFVSCQKNQDPGCNFTAGTTVAPASEKDTVISYLRTKNITTAVELENSGMYYQIILAGDVAKPSLCSLIQINYILRQTNDNIYEQTTIGNPATFYLYELIEGWKRGIPLIGVGGKIRLFIPPSMGYGPIDRVNSRTGAVLPGNSVLIFDIDLIAFR